MKSNLTNDSIFNLLKDTIDDTSIDVTKSGHFPSASNTAQYATIIVKSDNRPDAFELVEDFLKDNKLSYKEKRLPGSTFNGFEVSDYYPVGKREKGIRILFKFASGREAPKNYYMWNSLLTQVVFKKDRSLVRAPKDRNEIEVISKINERIEKLGGGQPVDLFIRTKRFSNVAGVVGGVGTKKCDIVIVNMNAEEIGFLSYKSGTTASDFQQYSGITERASKKINDNNETKKFKEVVVSNWDTYVKEGYSSMWSEINDNALKKQAIFGPDYARKSGYDSVDFVVQGTPKLKKAAGRVYLTFGKTVKKRDLSQLQGAYEPVLGARKGERSRRIRIKSGSISGVRGGVFTRGYMDKRNSKQV